MTDNIDEEISTLLDGEITMAQQARILKAMTTNEKLQQKWHGYHLIGDAIKRQLSTVSHPAITQQIRSALANEPELNNLKTPVTLLRKSIKMLLWLAIIFLCAIFPLVWKYYYHSSSHTILTGSKSSLTVTNTKNEPL